MRTLFSLPLVWMLIFSSWNSSVVWGQSTILGGEITYHYMGSDAYEVIINVFADCKGNALGNTQTLKWSSACMGGITDSLSLPLVSGYPIDVTNSIFPGGSACNGGSGARGIERYVYMDTLVLSSACTDDVLLSWSTCCHSDSLTSILNPTSTPFYLESTLDPSLVSIYNYSNSSAQFVNYPLIGACVNWSHQYNHGAYDPEGDTVLFSLVPCQASKNQVVNYKANYSATAPLGTQNPISIDPQTGQILYQLNNLETAMICVLVEEYRGGTKIGSVVRNMMLWGTDCFINTPPTITGIDSTNNYDTTIVVGQPTCFDIHAEDIDTAQNLQMVWNSVIPGATFTIDTTAQPVGTFCWTPTLADTGQHYFTVQVNDFGTPIPGVVIEGFRINVVRFLNHKTIETNTQATYLRLEPNPASTQIKLHLQGIKEQPIQLCCIDAQGKIIQQTTTQWQNNPFTMEVNQLPQGLYAVVVLNEKGEYLTSQKLLIQH